MIQADAPLAIQNDEAGRPLERIGLHGQRNLTVRRRLVNANWKRQAVFMDKHLQRFCIHHGVVFKHGVQANNKQLMRRKRCLDAIGLRNALRDATGTQHLEGVQDHDAPEQVFQADGLWRVEPLTDLQHGRQFQSGVHGY